jgi:tetratricopeptide (TPR) repeat protein
VLIGADLGPYRILDRLGSGAMGTVFLGLHGTDRVAIKVFHPHLLEQPGFLDRFRREAEMGLRVDHPNVVRTLDSRTQVVDGLPCYYLVMEYVEGITLREVLEDEGVQQEALLREIGRQVALGLEAIHASRIVHRDLKPENVLITRDDEVKIMDLGVALLRDETIRLSSSGQFLGSILYAAPEQFPGTERIEVDGRADLYALGMVLYELAAGDHPCYDGSMVRALELRSDGGFRRLGEVRLDVSEFFEEIVHTLLEKDREDRFPSASTLVETLAEGEASRWWRSRARRGAPPARPPRRISIRRDTRLHGRGEELRRLETAFEEVETGRGRVLLLTGEAGVGKTRLVDELVGRLLAESRDLAFLFGAYPPGGAATATGAFCTAFREHLGDEGLEEVVRSHLRRVPGLASGFAAFLRGEPGPGGSTLDRESAQTAFVEVLRSLASRRPIVLALDDLQLAPEEGHALFAALAWAIPEHRVLLLGTARPGLPDAWVSQLVRLPHVERVRLGRLSPAGVEEILLDLLRSESMVAEVAPTVATWSEGNPFFVLEAFRGLEEKRLLVRTSSGAWRAEGALAGFPTPATVRDLIETRISSLAEKDRALLDVAACLGHVFDPVLAGEAIGMGAIAALRTLDRLERSHRLVRATVDRFAFDHHLVREALYEGLSRPLREGLHAALGEALERRHEADSRDPGTLVGDLPVILCEQFLAGGKSRRAVRYLDAALDRLEASGGNHDALRLAERALEIPGLLEGARRASMLLRAAEFLEIVGRREDGQEAARKAVDLALESEEPLLRIRAWRLLGTFALGERPEEAADLLRRAGELAREIGHAGEEAATLMQEGNLAAGAGRCAEARGRYERVLELGRDLGNRRQIARAFGGLGNSCLRIGRMEEALENARRCCELFIEVEDRLGELRARGLLGATLVQLGRHAEGERELRHQLLLAREIGYRRGECLATGNLGLLHYNQDHLEQAREQFSRALEIATEIGDRQMEALESCRLGGILVDLGRARQARELLRWSLERQRESGDRMNEAYVLWDLGRAHEQLGELEDAEASYRRAAAIREEISPGEDLRATVLSLARLLRRTGRDEEAVEALRRIVDETEEVSQASLVASAHLVHVGELDRAPFLDRLAREAGHTSPLLLAEIHYLLWDGEAGGHHLAEARRLLLEVWEHVAPADPEGLFRRIPLHRDILEGCRPGAPSRRRPVADDRGDPDRSEGAAETGEETR